MKGKVCELCNQQASLYCPSDSAFLCRNCDAAVHGANFLVARHPRHLLCSNYDGFAGIHISAAPPRHNLQPTCSSCSPEKTDLLLLPCSSSSESCSTALKNNVKVGSVKARVRSFSNSSSVTGEVSPARKRRRRNVGSAAAEVIAKWSRELGLGLGLGVDGNRLASEALGLCVATWRFVPFRVAAAASFWLGLRFCGGDGSLATFRNLSRLEAIAGVPAKLILAAHAKLARSFTHRRELQEGWDES